MEASDFMGMSPRTPGGKKLQLLTTVTFTPINGSSTATSSFQTYDLSEFNVVGKKAEDFRSYFRFYFQPCRKAKP